MSNASNRKGDRRERELVNELDLRGFAVLRAPASGSATDRDLPDVLAGNGGQFFAIEAKSSSGDPIYIDDDQVVSLEYFANAFGAEPLIGARFDRNPWTFYDPAELHRTDSGNYRVKADLSMRLGRTLDDLEAGPGDHTVDTTLAELMAACYVHLTGPISLKELAQLARYAGIDEDTIARSQTYSKQELVKEGRSDV